MRGHTQKVLAGPLHICHMLSTVNVFCRYGHLLDQVRSTGGDVIIFSSFNAPGERLEKIGGVAAMCRFPTEFEMEEVSTLLVNYVIDMCFLGAHQS